MNYNQFRPQCKRSQNEASQNSYLEKLQFYESRINVLSISFSSATACWDTIIKYKSNLFTIINSLSQNNFIYFITSNVVNKPIGQPFPFLCDKCVLLLLHNLWMHWYNVEVQRF